MIAARSILRSNGCNLRRVISSASVSTQVSASTALPSLRTLSALSGNAPAQHLFPHSRVIGHAVSSARLFSSSVAACQSADAQVVHHVEKTEQADGAQSDQFSSLQDFMLPTTYEALTGAPFNYTTMSDVQKQVLNQLPQLSRPLKSSSFHPTVKIGGTDPGSVPETVSDALKKAATAGPSDLLVKAKTGTGKTLAFLVPAVEARARAIEAAAQGFFTKSVLNLLEKSGSRVDFSSMGRKERSRFALSVFQTQTAGALILSPTRELAAQIAREADKLVSRHGGMNVHLLVGGEPKPPQLRKLDKFSKDIIVATPGRIIDLLDASRELRDALACTETFILDEADTLLEMGFEQEVLRIQEYLPSKEQRRNFFFSATVSRDTRDIAMRTLDSKFKMIDCVPEGEAQVHERVPQFGFSVDAKDQLTTLVRLIAHDQLIHGPKSKIIVFCNTTKLTMMVARLLKSPRLASFLPSTVFGDAPPRRNYRERSRDSRPYPPMEGFQALEMHAGLTQMQRSRVSTMFREANTPTVLVTTDVSARGVDYPNVTKVIQLGAPKNSDTYIHRIGRTGRAGKEGRADIILLQGWEDSWPRLEGQAFPIKPTTPEAFKEEMNDLWEKKQSSRAGKQPISGEDNVIMSTNEEALRDWAMSELQGKVEEMLSSMDNYGNPIRSVWLSLLGFYVEKAKTLRLSKGDIVVGLKEYGRGSFGLTDYDLHISSSLATQLGLSGEMGLNSGSRGGPGGRGGEPRRFDGGDGYGDGRSPYSGGRGGRLGGRGGGEGFGVRGRGEGFGRRGRGEDFGGRGDGEDFGGLGDGEDFGGLGGGEDFGGRGGRGGRGGGGRGRYGGRGRAADVDAEDIW